MQRLMAHRQGVHQQSLLVDASSVSLYERLGFVRAGRTEPMWIYEGHEHRDFRSAFMASIAGGPSAGYHWSGAMRRRR